MHTPNHTVKSSYIFTRRHFSTPGAVSRTEPYRAYVYVNGRRPAGLPSGLSLFVQPRDKRTSLADFGYRPILAGRPPRACRGLNGLVTAGVGTSNGRVLVYRPRLADRAVVGTRPRTGHPRPRDGRLMPRLRLYIYICICICII